MRDAEGLCTRLPLCCGFVCPVAVLRQGIFAPYGRKNHPYSIAGQPLLVIIHSRSDVQNPYTPGYLYGIQVRG